MDRILKILKKENGPRASSAPALELNTIIFKHVYWYMQQISGERLQDHWSSGFFKDAINRVTKYREKNLPLLCHLAVHLLNSPGARADLPPVEVFLDPRLMVILQLINCGAIIPINTSRVQVNYPDAT